MLVAQIQDNYEIGLSETPVPSLPPKGAIMRLIGCGLCGSDLDKFKHKKARPGSVLGHEVVGILDALDDGHPSGYKLGDRIVAAHHVPCGTCHYCLNDSESMCRQFKSTNLTPGGFSQYIALTEGHLQKTAFRIPADVSDAEASCVEPLACVLRAIQRGGEYKNGAVAIVGLGFIGLMAAQVYLRKGYAVYGLDIDPERIQLAQANTLVTQAFDAKHELEQLNRTLKNHTLTGKVDLVFLSVVNRRTLRQAQDLVRDGGNIVIFTQANETAPLIDPSALYFREINLITSYSPSLQDLKASAEMIFKHEINVKPLISHTLPLQEIQEAFALYQAGKAIKVFIQAQEKLE